MFGFDMPSKKNWTEREIITKYFIPALEKAGWDTHKQIREDPMCQHGCRLKR